MLATKIIRTMLIVTIFRKIMTYIIHGLPERFNLRIDVLSISMSDIAFAPLEPILFSARFCGIQWNWCLNVMLITDTSYKCKDILWKNQCVSSGVTRGPPTDPSHHSPSPPEKGKMKKDTWFDVKNTSHLLI